MKRKFKRILPLALIMSLLLSLAFNTFAAETAPLVPQELDYTENPVDIPNPDRGFYRANDGMVVPVAGEGDAGDIMEVGKDPVNISDTGVMASTRISHVYFDLRNFSGNSFTARGTRYDENYRAPEGTEIGEGKEYASHFDYWLKNVVPTWPNGVTRPLTDDALAYIRNKLLQVRNGQGVTMVRFNYDGMGYAWVDCDHPVDGYIDQLVANVEPNKATILKHIEQLKPILREFEDVIMGVDGGFFGPWGEMHSTSFGTSPKAYAWLLNALLDAVPPSRSITVHGGAFLSWYNETYDTDYTFDTFDKIPAPKPGTPEARFGFFNDSYGYGADEPEDGEEPYPDDWGSLSEGAGWPDGSLAGNGYDRGKLMTWIRRQNGLYGGEAQGDETLWNTYPFVAWEASYAQTVYLNADYEDVVHQRWADFDYTQANVTKQMTNAYTGAYKTEYAVFDPLYSGRNGLEYWRDRLGYRLVLRDANASEKVAKNGELRFEGKIQNVGFGNIVNRKNVSVILKSVADGKAYAAPTDIDARKWRPDLDSRASNEDAYRDLSFSVAIDSFDGEIPAGEYEIYLKINDPHEKSANKRCIRFANKGGYWDAELGANLIGRTTVTA